MPATDLPFLNLGQGDDDSRSATPLEAFVNDDESDAQMAARVQRRVNASMPTVRVWQAKAKEAQRFYDGHQWEDYDKTVMEQSKRPILTFNEIKKIIRAVCGLERLNRTDVFFRSRATDSSLIEDAMGDLATEAVSTIDDLSEAPYERSLVVKDLSIGGMGWFEIFCDFSEELDGQIRKERINPLEMSWDVNSRRSGLGDSQWRARRRNMPRDLFKRRWPEKLDLVDAGAPEPGEFTVHKYRLVTPYYSLANEQANPQVGEPGAMKDTIPVLQYQERFEVEVYRLANPDKPGELIELSEKNFKELKKEFERDGLPLPPVIRQTKTVYRQIYVSNGVLLEKPVLLPGGHFSLLCMTGEWDEEDKIWVGLVPDMIDPQKTKNKSLSAGLHFYLANAKGGTIFETGTFANQSRAKDEWSSPNAWIEVNEGKLDKVMGREPINLPTSLQAFFEIGTRSITDVMGVSQELLGLGQSEMSDPTQRNRVAASLAILGWFFDEINRFKKEEARTTLDFIKEFATDGQLIQIGGMFNAKAIPLLKENLPDKYRLEVDESVKHNPSLKDRIWRDLTPIIPALLRFGAGPILLSLLKFSPLPAQVVHDIQRMVMQTPPQDPKGRGKKDSPEIEAAKAQKLIAEAQESLAHAKQLDQQGALKVAELLIEAIGLAGESKDKEKLDHRQKVLDTIETLQTLLPKGGNNGR